MDSFTEIPPLWMALPVLLIVVILGGLVAYRYRQRTTAVLAIVVAVLLVVYAVAWTFFADLPPS